MSPFRLVALLLVSLDFSPFMSGFSKEGKTAMPVQFWVPIPGIRTSEQLTNAKSFHLTFEIDYESNLFEKTLKTTLC